MCNNCKILWHQRHPIRHSTSHLQGAIDYSEQRIYRDFWSLLQTVTTDTSVSTIVGNRQITLPNSIVAVNGINLFAPASTRRIPLVPVSRDAVDRVWPVAPMACRDVRHADPVDRHSRPAARNTYSVEVVGTTRLAPLSATNTSTFISTYLPDMMIAASMVYMSGFQRNFGNMGNDPQMVRAGRGSTRPSSNQRMPKSCASNSGATAGALPPGTGSTSRG